MCQTLYVNIMSHPHNKFIREVFYYPQFGERGMLRLGIGDKLEVTGEPRTEPKCPHLHY